MTDLVPLLQSSFERAPWGWALAGAVMVALIKVWPVLALQAREARVTLRKEKRDDLSSCQEKIKALEGQLAELREAFHNLELKLVGSLSAFRIVETEIVATNPDCPALAQARAALRVAFTISADDDPLADHIYAPRADPIDRTEKEG